MRVLVTGADGFVGRHLCRLLRAAGDEVIEAGGPREGPAPAQDEDRIALDVADAAAVRAAVERARPEGVVHLAGFSSVGLSNKQPGRTFEVNTVGTVNLLAALADLAPAARAVLISSAEVYGPVAPGTRAAEDHPLRPLNPYAASKAAAEVAAFTWQRARGLPVVVARSFNHVGSGQAPAFVVPAFAAQLAAIKAGKAEPVLRVGDLSPVRDFSHVEDVVAAYRLLLQRGQPGEAYNVCSGEGRSIRQVLDLLLSIAGVQARVEVDPARLRPSELPSLVGDAGKLQGLGWSRRRTLAEALGEALASASRA